MLRFLTLFLLILSSFGALAQRDNAARRSGSTSGSDDVLLNQSGIAIHFDVGQSEGDFTQEFKAYDESGNIIWTYALGETDIVQSKELTSTELIIVYSQSDRDGVATELVVVDSATGNAKWQLAVDGKVVALTPSPNGYFLHYASVSSTTVSRHLAFVDANGVVAWDKTVDEYFGRSVGDSDGVLGGR